MPISRLKFGTPRHLKFDRVWQNKVGTYPMIFGKLQKIRFSGSFCNFFDKVVGAVCRHWLSELNMTMVGARTTAGSTVAGSGLGSVEDARLVPICLGPVLWAKKSPRLRRGQWRSGMASGRINVRNVARACQFLRSWRLGDS